MEVWGITGLTGSGKSTAIEHIKALGYPTLDADSLARLVVDRKTDMGKEGFEKIYKLFGSTVLDNLGNLDKKALMKKIITSPTDKERLEGVIDPLVFKAVEQEMTKWKSQDTEFAFVEGSRLAESGFHKMIAGLIRVSCSYDKRVTRIAKRDSMGKLEVEMMFRMQDEQLMKINSKYEFKNDNKPKDLVEQIDKFIMDRRAKKGL